MFETHCRKSYRHINQFCCYDFPGRRMSSAFARIRSMLRQAIAVLCLLGLAISPCLAREQTITDNVEILDGQTIRLHEVVIKLWGIAAPVADEPGASMAAVALYRLYDRNVVTCHMPSDWGHGEAIGKCEAAGYDLGAVMVSSGFALDCPAMSGGHYRIHEQKARAKGTIFLTGYELPARCRTKTK
jgi:hypothetical protein